MLQRQERRGIGNRPSDCGFDFTYEASALAARERLEHLKSDMTAKE